MADLLSTLRLPTSTSSSPSIPHTISPPQSSQHPQGIKRPSEGLPGLTMRDVEDLIRTETSSRESPSSALFPLPPRPGPVTSSSLQGQATTGDISSLDDYLSRSDVEALRKLPSNGNQGNSTTPEAAAQRYPEPIEIGKSNNLDPVGSLYHWCQLQGTHPSFDLVEVRDQKFTGSVSFSGHTVPAPGHGEGIGPFSSKKEAKEALAGRALELIKTLPETDPAEVDGQNWVGILQELCQLLTRPSGMLPTYNVYALSPTIFSAECKLPLLPASVASHLPASVPKTFGSRTGQFVSKKAAKIAAAREAYQYLAGFKVADPTKLNGSSSSHTEGPANKKAKISNPAILAESRSPNSSSSSPLSKMMDEKLKSDVSYGQRVNELCHSLNLPSPIYRFASTSPETPAMVSGAAYFEWSGGNQKHPPLDCRLAGAVGEVRHVYGKKVAKEKCAKTVWFILDIIRQERAGLL